eukprot:5289539-Heterocapsa_arctica.AAC.1
MAGVNSIARLYGSLVYLRSSEKSVTTSGGGARARTRGKLKSLMRPAKDGGDNGGVAATLLTLMSW